MFTESHVGKGVEGYMQLLPNLLELLLITITPPSPMAPMQYYVLSANTEHLVQ